MLYKLTVCLKSLEWNCFYKFKYSRQNVCCRDLRECGHSLVLLQGNGIKSVAEKPHIVLHIIKFEPFAAQSCSLYQNARQRMCAITVKTVFFKYIIN